ncbi:unnamed protein product, partial [Protopolystoma xenopodis]
IRKSGLYICVVLVRVSLDVETEAKRDGNWGFCGLLDTSEEAGLSASVSLNYWSLDGAFLVPYFVSVFLAGVPIFFLEVALGQFMSRGGVEAWNICPLLKAFRSLTTDGHSHLPSQTLCFCNSNHGQDDSQESASSEARKLRAHQIHHLNQLAGLACPKEIRESASNPHCPARVPVSL